MRCFAVKAYRGGIAGRPSNVRFVCALQRVRVVFLQSLAVGYLDRSGDDVEAISACWVNGTWTFSLRRGAGPLDISYLLCLMHYDLRFLGEIPDVTVQPVFWGCIIWDRGRDGLVIAC